MGEPITRLHPLEYEHPFDAKALAALQKTPGLDSVLKQYGKQAVEPILRVQYTGSSLRISNQNYPDIYSFLERVCETLNLSDCPDLFLDSSSDINATAIGTDRPIVIVSSGAIDNLEEPELLFLLGHAVGHIKSRHTLYQQITDIFPHLADIVGMATLGVSKLLSAPLQLALMRWSRMSMFTADRAGLLACQSVEAAMRVMMKWAGLPSKYFDDAQVEWFLRQARDFEKLDYNKLNTAIKLLAIVDSAHPWTVMRAAELDHWIEGGDYEGILARETTDRVFKRIEDALEFCRKCNHRLKGSEKFCPTCGGPLQSPA